MASKFDKMQEEMSRLVDGTESYESFKEQVIQDYRKCVKDGYLKNVREYKETHLRKGLIVFFLFGLFTIVRDGKFYLC